MSDRALFGAIFVAGVVTAVVAGLELGLVELRPPGPQRAPARVAGSEAAKPAPAWSPPAAAVGPAEAAPRVAPTVEAERLDPAGAAPAPGHQSPDARVPGEPSGIASAQGPAAAPHATAPEVPAILPRESRPGEGPAEVAPTQPPRVADAPPRTDAPADRAVAHAGAAPPARTRLDVRALPLVDAPAAPGPRESLAPDATAHALATVGPTGAPLMGSAVLPSAPNAPAPLIADPGVPAAQPSGGAPAAREFPRPVSAHASERRPLAPATTADTTVPARETLAIVPPASSTPEPRTMPPAMVPLTRARETPATAQRPASLRAMPHSPSGRAADDAPAVRATSAAPAATPSPPSAPIAIPAARSDAALPAREAPPTAASSAPVSRVPRDNAAPMAPAQPDAHTSTASPPPQPSAPALVAAPSRAATAAPAAPIPMEVVPPAGNAAATEPSGTATASEPSRTATATPLIKPPDVVPRVGTAPVATLVTPSPPTSEPSTHVPHRPRTGATHSRKRPPVDAFRSRASLGRPASAVRRRAPVSVLYGAPPAYRGSGPILIRIHRARNGRVRTTRIPLH